MEAAASRPRFSGRWRQHQRPPGIAHGSIIGNDLGRRTVSKRLLECVVVCAGFPKATGLGISSPDGLKRYCFDLSQASRKSGGGEGGWGTWMGRRISSCRRESAEALGRGPGRHCRGSRRPFGDNFSCVLFHPKRNKYLCFFRSAGFVTSHAFAAAGDLAGETITSMFTNHLSREPHCVGAI